MTRISICGKALIVIVLLCVVGAAEAISGSGQGQVTVVFRYDDYSSLSPTNLEIKLIKAFKKHHVPCTFGVIPYRCAGEELDPTPQSVVRLTPAKAIILKNAVQAGILEVALHGYSHQTTPLTTERRPRYTEFFGVDYGDQILKIAKGKKLLEEMVSTRITTFIPPFDSYDLNTIWALEKTEFKSISAWRKGATRESSQLRFLPSTCHLLNLQDAVRSARKFSADNQSVIVVSLHPYDFLEVDKQRGRLEYQDFADLLNWVASQQYIRTYTIAKAADMIEDLTSRRLQGWHNFYSSLPHALLPPPLAPPETFYPSLRTLHLLKLKSWLYLALFYPLLLAASFASSLLVGAVVFRRYRSLGPIAKYGGLLLMGLVLAYTFGNLRIGFKGAAALTCLLGICSGIWGSLYKLKKQVHLN